MRAVSLWALAPFVFALALACSSSGAGEELLRDLPLNSLAEVITKSGVTFDSAVTTDGNGSIMIAAADTTTVRIAEVDGLSVENVRLVYRARLRTANVRGKAYLEMWCVFPGQGEFFSRALYAPLSGTNDWVNQETPFFLQEGQTPSLVRLNLVIEGSGTVWIDQVTLSKAPLAAGG